MSRSLLLALIAVVGCGDDPPAPAAPAPCLAPNRPIDGRCLGPGVADDGCPAGTLGDGDGGCRPAGVTSDACGAGFVHDGDVGCVATLPAEACPPGRIAVPGDTACREVMPCGQGRWGDIPVEPSTQYVDAAYAAADSDGSEAKPWTTIGAAYDAAAPGELVAVAAGIYAEDVIAWKPVRIWGVCPDEVEIVGTGVEVTAVFIGPDADGSEVHGIALRGPNIGLQQAGAEDVVVDRVWVHDTAGRGIQIQATRGPTSVSIRDTLVEQSREVGIYAAGSLVTIERTVVRDVQPQGLGQRFGRGVSIEPVCTPGCDPATRSTATIRGSLVERNHEVGVFVMGSDATVEATVVRDTLPDASDDARGRGLHVQLACNDSYCDADMRGKLDVRGAIVERNRDLGIVVMGSDVTIGDTVVRDTWPRVSDEKNGWGIAVQPPCTGSYCYPEIRSSATVRGSLVERCHEYGLAVGASDAIVESTVVRDTAQSGFDQTRGQGVSVQLFCDENVVCDKNLRSSATLRACVVDRNHEAGILVAGSDTIVDACVIRATAPRADGLFGDGVAVVFQTGAPATAAITSSVLVDSGRAGLASFGGDVAIASTAVQCAAFELDSETNEGRGAVFEDRGANACGCPTPANACIAVSSGLAPPAPVASFE